MRLPAAAVSVALAVALVASCGPSARPAGRAANPDAARLILTCPVADADVWVDGRYIAPCGALGRGLRLEPGERRLEVRHDDHHAFYAILDLAPRERRALTVDLAEILR